MNSAYVRAQLYLIQNMEHIKKQNYLRGTLAEIDEKAYIAFRVEQCLDFDTVTKEIYSKREDKQA